MDDLHAILEYSTFYHIYNRGIDKTNLFREEKNYRFFLEKYDLYLSKVVDTYAYCLLKNHFHLLVCIKNEESLADIFEQTKPIQKRKGGLHSPEHIVSKQFARLFSSYTQSFNKVYERTSSLFDTPFKRKRIDNEDYLIRLAMYIQTNAQKHQFVSDFRNYPHSSYHSILSDKPTKLKRDEVISWFGNRNLLIESHLSFMENEDDKIWIIE